MQTRSQIDQPPAEPRAAAELTILGASTCEDTALVRSRLQIAGMPFTELDIDLDSRAADRLARITGGGSPTPTLLFSRKVAASAASADAPAADQAADDTLVSEPDLDTLDALLARAGYRIVRPSVTQFHGDATTRPVPFRTLMTSRREPFSLEQVRSSGQAVLFLGHDASCLACMGYARQLERQADRLAGADAVAIAAIENRRGNGDLAVWHREVGPGLTILIDRDGEWKRAVLEAVGRPQAGVALLMLDRFAAAGAASFADEAGGLANPSQAVEWLDFIALACPECSAELPWSDAFETRG